ncbi:MAG TPA: hypothetical protein VJ951_02855 [Bacteroidales bacterium]|nr:hypothetical protein [Bacteroidales bacterium]
MKPKSLINSKLFVFSLFISVFMFNSCSKEEFSGLSERQVLNEIVNFDSQEDFSTTLEKVVGMSSEELKAYEASKGYKSFGRTCEEFYRGIDFDDFTSLEELKAFIEKNSEYLTLVEDEEGELVLETVLSRSPYRYFVNNDKLFRIKDEVYKVFGDGVISTNVSNIEVLKEMNSTSVTGLDVDEQIRVMASYRASKFSENQLKDAVYNCGRHAEARKTNKRDRTKIEISIDYLDTYDINNVPMTIYENRVLIRPYKRTLGVWYWCSRTLSCDIKVAIDHKTASGWQRGFYYKSESGKHTSKLEYIMSGGVVSIGSWQRYDMHYGGYDCWADSPSTSHVHLECNTSLF